MSTKQAIANDYAAAIDVCKSRKAAAILYADALRTYGPDGLEWRTVNGAILRRWSMSSLASIKREAWKRARASLGAEGKEQ